MQVEDGIIELRTRAAKRQAEICREIESRVNSCIVECALLRSGELEAERFPDVAEAIALTCRIETDEIFQKALSRELFPDLTPVQLYNCDGKARFPASLWHMPWRHGVLRPEATSIHDHGASSVGIYVVRGQVSEYIYSVDREAWLFARRSMTSTRSYRLLKAGEKVFIPAPYIHRMLDHIDEGDSIHFYGNPPLTRQTSYLQYGGRLYRDSEWSETVQSTIRT